MGTIPITDYLIRQTLNVTLPGEKFTVIESIMLSDLELVMTDDSEAFSPLASSEHTLAEFKNPFGFSLQVIKSGENITLSEGGIDVAEVCQYLLFTDILLRLIFSSS